MRANGQRDRRSRLMRSLGWGAGIIFRQANFLASLSGRVFIKTSSFNITLPALVLAPSISTNLSHAQTAASPVPAFNLASQAAPCAAFQRGANQQVRARFVCRDLHLCSMNSE